MRLRPPTWITLAVALACAAPAAAASGAPARDSLVFVPRDTLSERLRRPAGLMVDAFGRVTVADEERHALERFGADGRWLDGTGGFGSAPAQFRRPGALTALGALGTAVLDRDNRRVVAYDQQLRLIGVLVDFSLDDAQSRFGRVDPVAVTSDAGGAVLVADADRDRLLGFDFAGVFVREWGGFGGRAGAFAGLVAVGVTPRGEVVTLERGARARRPRAGDPPAAPPRARLQWLDAGGRVVASAGLEWPQAEAREASLAVDASGRVAVANGASGELRLLAPDGRTLATLTGLASPAAVAFGPDGALWVAETAAARVRSFTIAPAPAGD